VAPRRAVVRSYQRLFSPDRRIYAIDGRTIPVPGGVPLRWLGVAAAIIGLELMIAGPRPIVALAAAGLVYGSVARLGRRRRALVAAAVVGVVLLVAGAAIGTMDWPLRFVVIPAAGATALTQIAPDGRRPVRYLRSLARVQVAGRRRGEVALPSAGAPRRLVLELRVAADHYGPALHRARITGPCRLAFAEPVLVIGRRGRARRLVPVAGERRRMGVMVDRLDLAVGHRVEVRP
jgi:hypothetical protein